MTLRSGSRVCRPCGLDFDCHRHVVGRNSPGPQEARTWRNQTKKNKPLSKSEILNAVADAVGEEVSRKHVKEVVETLVTVGHKELKKNGIFVLPGFAKFVVVKKPARPARKGINPFTKEKQMFAAKPASKAVRRAPGEGRQGRGGLRLGRPQSRRPQEPEP